MGSVSHPHVDSFGSEGDVVNELKQLWMKTRLACREKLQAPPARGTPNSKQAWQDFFQFIIDKHNAGEAEGVITIGKDHPIAEERTLLPHIQFHLDNKSDILRTRR